MRLLSADQASVELLIARYQFPGCEGQGNRDWDANWLQVAGTVVLADRKTWSFEDPCMTTWEAAELGRWLNAVADGSVQPSPFGTGQDEHLLVFTEPNVAFSLQERIASRVRVRVHFSLAETAPVPVAITRCKHTACPPSVAGVSAGWAGLLEITVTPSRTTV